MKSSVVRLFITTSCLQNDSWEFTGHSEGHQGSDLPLQAVGGDAGVVASVAAGDFSEMKLAVPLFHVGG